MNIFYWKQLVLRLYGKDFCQLTVDELGDEYRYYIRFYRKEPNRFVDLIEFLDSEIFKRC